MMQFLRERLDAHVHTLEVVTPTGDGYSNKTILRMKANFPFEPTIFP